MILNIDTRVFNFILPKNEKRRKNLHPTSNFVWFYKDHIRINDLKSLLIIPCENQEIKDKHIGVRFEALRKNIAHKGKNNKVEIEVFVKDDGYEGFRLKGFNPTLLGASDTQKAFVCLGEHIFKCKVATSCYSFKLEEENKDFKNKIDLYPSIFKELFFSGDNVLKVGNGDLYLRSGTKFNGLDRNKGFTLYYDELGESKLYKAVQDDVTLYEMGGNSDE